MTEDATYESDLDAWTNMPCSVPTPVRTFTIAEMAAAERAAEDRNSFLADLEEDRLRALGWW